MTTARRVAAALLALLLVALAGRLVHVAWTLPLDYWDGFDYLVHARAFAGADLSHLAHAEHVPYRPPLLSLLAAPLMGGYRPAGEGLALVGPHLLSAALALLCLPALYWMLRAGLPARWCALGAWLLAWNPLFTHYAPFFLSDVPVMLFAACGLGAYLRGCERGRPGAFALAGLALGAAMATKYSALLAFAALPAFELLRAGSQRAARAGAARALARALLRPRAWGTLGLALLVFQAVHVIAFSLGPWEVDPFTYVIDCVASGAAILAGLDHRTNPPGEYATALVAVFGAPLAAAALLGLGLGCARRSAADLLHLCFLTGFFASHILLVRHKEARYLFLALPSLIHFQLTGLRALCDALEGAARARPARGRPGRPGGAARLARRGRPRAAREIPRPGLPAARDGRGGARHPGADRAAEPRLRAAGLLVEPLPRGPRLPPRRRVLLLPPRRPARARVPARPARHALRDRGGGAR